MDYHRIYNELINSRINNTPTNVYIEKHHIIPKSFDGDDSNENIVVLTAREHFICHLLLAKMYKMESLKWYKMNYALSMMKCSSYKHHRYFNSKLYSYYRIRFKNYIGKRNSKSQLGSNNSQFGTIWICNINLKQNKKVKKDDVIPQGWICGRNKWKPIVIRRIKKVIRNNNGLTPLQEKDIERRTKKYEIDGIIYSGCKTVANEFNITHPTVLNRCKNINFPNWKVL